ncbi:ABC transporter ATP-binding protein [Pseudoflavitalea sp. X16]|uniref:ABC transporter ATP-binding protein n=1 Tax=Paraflavitalea devenefica TaxID=2716334 RepID=UPI00141DD31F|nr:ABC transporter ATP-binding protein [Paraflavitalea devenefica]NII27816.1 ABC transporter ATP-binding protein [Paraflavitalea devenefica]
MIRIEHLKKRFKKLQALDDINALFREGQVISLIGPNGSGKTTLIKTILGMVTPDEGDIFVDQQSIRNNPVYRVHIGYMPQIGRYPDNMKVGQLFDMMKAIRRMPDSELDTDLLVRFNLVSIFDKPMRTLSGGTRQKVSAALAFYFNPRILILDEPTAGLDPLSSEILKEKILEEKKKNKLILITSHILSDLDDLTTHVMYMQEGKMRFLKDIDSLREETGEHRLGKAIARVMKAAQPDALWINEVLAVKQTTRNL